MNKATKNLPPLRGKVSPEWLGNGVWLDNAALAFGPPSLVAELQDQANQFSSLMDHAVTAEDFERSLPKQGASDYLKGRLDNDQRKAISLYLSARERLELDLNVQLKFSGRLRAFGARGDPGALIEWIPFQSWFYLKIDKHRPNVATGEGGTWYYVQVVRPIVSAPVQSDKPSQQDVTTWMQNYFQSAFAKHRPKPKRTSAFVDCRAAIGASDDQMEEAMKHVPNDLKRQRGGRDRQIG